MRIIAVYNHKGGTGKTVTSVNFAYNLSAIGKKVLLIDMDPQGNSSAFYGRHNFFKPSIADVLTGRKKISRCIYRTRYKNLDIIQANMTLCDLTKEQLGPSEEFKLAESLSEIENRYDFCIIDCPPSAGILIKIVMAAAMEVIVPLKPDRFSVDGLDSVIDIVNEYGTNGMEISCLFTQDYRSRDAKRAIEHVIETTNIAIYSRTISRSCAVDHSVYVHRPLAKCASRSTSEEDYLEFTKEYLEKEELVNGFIGELA